MKSIIKYVLPVLTGLFFVLAACEKEDIPYYSDVERINFDYTSMGLSKDTVNIAYGFVTDQYTNIDLELLLTGYAKDYDRVIGLTITSEDGAVAGTNYEIADNVIMPKGEVSISVPLKVLRSEDLMTTGAKSFLVKLVDSDDLVAGLRTTLFVTVSDDIPDKWIGDEGWFMNPISQYFGECSKTKYLFVYEQLGVWDFSSWSYWGMMGDAAKFTPAKRILKEKLAEYEAENGPLVDPRKICLTNGKYIRRTLKKMMMCRNMTPPWFYTRKQFSIRSYMKFRVPII